MNKEITKLVKYGIENRLLLLDDIPYAINLNMMLLRNDRCNCIYHFSYLTYLLVSIYSIREHILREFTENSTSLCIICCDIIMCEESDTVKMVFLVATIFFIFIRFSHQYYFYSKDISLVLYGIDDFDFRR